jgi:hypothetical protein
MSKEAPIRKLTLGRNGHGYRKLLWVSVYGAQTVAAV